MPYYTHQSPTLPEHCCHYTQVGPVVPLAGLKEQWLILICYLMYAIGSALHLPITLIVPYPFFHCILYNEALKYSTSPFKAVFSGSLHHHHASLLIAPIPLLHTINFNF
ncbi:hypothetical protein BDQ12DRAFT_729890 [Crucibulum laeve]|uniref:Uncharacterized protein n=1 Tax=Crucibulum laeve TaxID=68775 RepID=A0A5C3LEM4_9AGAR|nr:hypothetical protein BDQ12DRAFT_729890 [Crucibulum laeve]